MSIDVGSGKVTKQTSTIKGSVNSVEMSAIRGPMGETICNVI